MSVASPSDLRVLLILTATRWLPVGLMAGLPLLLALDRGLGLEQALAASAAQGVAVLLLELPTSGFSDAFGRRPVLLAAAALNVVAVLAYALAPSFAGFAVAAALTGAYRALDSGPLEAWYVDRVHARTPGSDVAPDLAHQSTVMGAALAAGALLAGAIILWHPIAGRSALLGPMIGALALSLAHLAATLLLLPPEGHRTGTWDRAAASLRSTPRIVAEGLGLLRRNRVLGALVAVQVFWAAAMVVAEQMTPIRLAELLGSTERAGAWNAPAVAAAWGAFALGAAGVGRLAGRLGAAPTAILGRLLHGAGAVAMGLVASPGGLVAASLATMALHGFANPPHAALLHREATSGTRATVLSLNSLAWMVSFAAAAPLLGLIGGRWSLSTAMVVGGLWSLIGAALYGPAWRRG